MAKTTKKSTKKHQNNCKRSCRNSSCTFLTFLAEVEVPAAPPPSSLLPSSALLDAADALAALDADDEEETPNILRMAEAVARSVSEVLRRRDFFFCCCCWDFLQLSSATAVSLFTALFTEFVDPEDEAEAVDTVDDVKDVAGRGAAGGEELDGKGAAPALLLLLLPPLNPTLVVDWGWCRTATDAEVILHSMWCTALAICY